MNEKKKKEKIYELFNRSIEYVNEGKFDKGIECLNEIIGLEPDLAADIDLYSLRGVINKDKGDYKMAIKDYSLAIELCPNVDVHIERASLYIQEGEYDPAIADCNAALGIDPNNARAFSNRGCAYVGKDEYDKAIADFKTVLQIDPDDQDIREFLEKIYEAQEMIYEEQAKPGGSPNE